jgi:hypothetical protein
MGNVNDGGNTMFAIGNGTATGGGTPLTRSTAFQVFKSGSIVAPSLSTATISAEPTGKVLVTKEYLTGHTFGFDIHQITITSTTNYSTVTLANNGLGQKGRNTVISNGLSAITITVSGGTDFCASYIKHGSGAITFAQGSGRTLILSNGTAILVGNPGSTATISSIGLTDYLKINNV